MDLSPSYSCLCLNRSSCSSNSHLILQSSSSTSLAMLAISPLETASCPRDGRGGGAALEAEDYAAAGGGVLVAGNGDHHHHDSFADAFSTGNLQLEDINFEDLFVGFDDGTGDVLPDLELDPNELLGLFDVDGFGEEMGMGSLGEMKSGGGDGGMERSGGVEEGQEGDSFKSSGGDQTVPEAEEDVKVSAATAASTPTPLVVDESNGKDRKTVVGLQKKRKIKVDWTPELHRRFVEAVDRLGVDKAVPSRILEIMGIDCLTRHNIASHLQKYRSHRKHVLAREAEAASWTHRRKIYSPTSTVGHAVPVLKRETIIPWVGAPATMGFPTPPLPTPPPPPPPPSPSVQSFRPLHVWGHPTVDHPMVHMWPKHHLVTSHPLHHHWVAPPPHDPSAFWLPPHYPSRTPRYPHHPPLPPQKFPSPSLLATGIPPPPPTKHHHNHNHHQFHPTKEIIDAVIGDVLTKPWLPLALGLKPPSVDSVLVELQREGIAKIPSHPIPRSSSLCS